MSSGMCSLQKKLQVSSYGLVPEITSSIPAFGVPRPAAGQGSPSSKTGDLCEAECVDAADQAAELEAKCAKYEYSYTMCPSQQAASSGVSGFAVSAPTVMPRPCLGSGASDLAIKPHLEKLLASRRRALFRWLVMTCV